MPININKVSELIDAIGTEDVRDLLIVYFNSTPEVLQNIHESFETGNAENLRFWGHRLKGSSATLGFDDISNLGKSIELKGQNEDCASAQEEVEKIDEEFIIIKQELRDNFPNLL